MLDNASQVRKHLHGNPLALHLGAFVTSLSENGYTKGTVQVKLVFLTGFGRWLRKTGRTVACLNEQCVDAFVKQKRRVHRGEPKTLRQFINHLRKRGLVPDRKLLCDRSPLADVLNRYETYLRSEQGLVTSTIDNYQSFVRKLLIDRFRKGPFLFRKLKPADISDFVLKHGHNMGVRTAQMMTTAFRSFLRYLFQKGELQADLAASVPTVADWRLSTVPKYLTFEEVERVLNACKRRTAIGRRDYAILLLLARLGLRAGEVVALELDDLNWRAGEILVRGKGLFHDRLPLPVEVGEALTAYLQQDRPACATRSRIHMHEGPTAGPCGRRDHDHHSSPSSRTSGLAPPFERGPPVSSQFGYFPSTRGGNDGGDRRSSSPSSPQHHGDLRQGGLRGPALCRPSMADWGWAMNRLEQALKDYLHMRRSLGFKLRLPGSLLRNFIAFVRAAGTSYITTELALRWATQPKSAQPSTWAGRLGMVRRFAIWLRATEPRTQIPPAGLLLHRYRRKTPYIYTDEEIGKLLRRTQQLRSRKGLRAHTFTTLFALLVVTGMRVNEALGLDRSDVDLALGILHVRRTKFGKSRYVPIHRSTVAALKKYAELRDRILPVTLTPGFFVSERGRRISDATARYTFAKLSQQVGLRASVKGRGPGRGPRLQDMRHRFAARTMIDWYRAGLDVERELPKLATYLGHVHIRHTYWYMEAVPELLQLATDRLIEREVQP